MSKPIPGRQYVVQSGDTVQSISAQAYGDATLWPRIHKANLSTLFRSSDEPVAGQVLIIPRLAENQAQRVANTSLQIVGKQKDDLTIIVNGIELDVMSADIITAIDNVADGWAATIAWVPGEDPQLDEALLPFSYAEASVYIGNELVVNGYIYTIGSTLTTDGSVKNIAGWSLTADIIDSNLKPPYEEANISLRQRAEGLIQPLGLSVVYDLPVDEFFDRVTAKATDTIFGHLAKLATQRGTLLTSTPSGDVHFTQSDASNIVGTLQEGDPTVIEWSATFEGRNRFNAYKAVGQSPGSNAKTAVAIDDQVPKSRFHTFTVNDTTDGNIQQAADWRRSKQIANTMAIQLPVSGWVAPNGTIYKKNTGITVISPTLHVPKGFTFLIKSVEFTFSNTGKSSLLHLIPPQAYTGEPIVEPWGV